MPDGQRIEFEMMARLIPHKLIETVEKGILLTLGMEIDTRSLE